MASQPESLPPPSGSEPQHPAAPPKKKKEPHEYKKQYWENGIRKAHDVQLSPHDPLEAHERGPCPKCQRSRYLYCYDCCVPLTAVPAVTPLPFNVSVISHVAEKRSTNTGVQLATLYPEQVTIHDIQHMPEGYDPARSLVLFPSPDALSPEDIEPGTIDRVFVIDSKWAKAKTLANDPALKGARHVALREFRTCFWRFHTEDTTEESVCTIEAVYFLLKQYCQAVSGRHGEADECHCYDNTLWYFLYQYKIVEAKRAEKDKAWKTKKEAEAAAAAAGEARGPSQGGEGAGGASGSAGVGDAGAVGREGGGVALPATEGSAAAAAGEAAVGQERRQPDGGVGEEEGDRAPEKKRAKVAP